MDVFWSKGYEATSLDDLCDETGLSRSSLYATFGSKRELLLQTVDRYVERRTPRIEAMLERSASLHEGTAFASLTNHGWIVPASSLGRVHRLESDRDDLAGPGEIRGLAVTD